MGGGFLLNEVRCREGVFYMFSFSCSSSINIEFVAASSTTALNGVSVLQHCLDRVSATLSIVSVRLAPRCFAALLLDDSTAATKWLR